MATTTKTRKKTPEKIMKNQVNEIEKIDKKPIEKSEETTWAAETYETVVDIWETDDALMLAADVPGVKSNDVELDLREGILTIQARVGAITYEGLQPLYSEYNVGNFHRSFSLGETIDQEQIKADLEHGVLTVTLPKREKAKPRRIIVA